MPFALLQSRRIRLMAPVATIAVLAYAAVKLVPGASADQPLASESHAADDNYPPGGLGNIVRLGEAMVMNTNEHPLTKPLIGNALSCASCHLDGGTHERAASFIGVAAAYPAWSPRDNRVLTLEDRIAQCFIRSQNGKLPAMGSDVTVAIAAYITWLSRGTKIEMNAAKPLGPNHITPLQPRETPADILRGEQLYLSRCASCHEEDGSGNDEGPPVWGDKSFNDGAGLSQPLQMGSWLKVSMPLDEEDLSDQEALDIAAYITSKPRPKFVQ